MKELSATLMGLCCGTLICTGLVHVGGMVALFIWAVLASLVTLVALAGPLIAKLKGKE